MFKECKANVPTDGLQWLHEMQLSRIGLESSLNCILSSDELQ